MTTIDAKIEVHGIGDVSFQVDTDEFLDAIGPVDAETEQALEEALDAYVDEHAYYASERWYRLGYERDSQKVLRTGLATALGIDPEDLTTDYSFCTCNWENHLSEDFGGTLWDTSDGRRFLTVESGDRGFMRPTVGVRKVTCDEPTYVIACNSSSLMIGCTECAFGLDTANDRVVWAELTRQDEDECVLDDLFCPACGHVVVAQVWI